MVLIVSAGDGFSDGGKVFQILDYLLHNPGIDLVVVPRKIGQAADVFPLVEAWGKSRRVRVVGERLSDSEVKKLGAGGARLLHRQILNKHKPDRVVAFPGRGDVEELLAQARAAGVKSIEVA